MYDNAGAPVSGEFRVNDTTGSGQYTPSIAALAGGGFAIAWFDDNSNYRILAQKFDAAGNRVDGELQLDNTGTSYDQEPAMLALANGSFVVSWRCLLYTSRCV